MRNNEFFLNILHLWCYCLPTTHFPWTFPATASLLPDTCQNQDLSANKTKTNKAPLSSPCHDTHIELFRNSNLKLFPFMANTYCIFGREPNVVCIQVFQEGSVNRIRKFTHFYNFIIVIQYGTKMFTPTKHGQRLYTVKTSLKEKLQQEVGKKKIKISHNRLST